METALDAPCFGAGWLAAGPGLRWTDGDATLHVPAGSVVEMRFTLFQHYAVAVAETTAVTTGGRVTAA